MSIVIWGAGAIGGTLGAYLIRAGHNIVFVDSLAAHVQAINEGGLKITGPVDEFVVQANASTPDDLRGEFDTILLCTKAQHTREATQTLAPHLKKDGMVVSVQNGLNELTIQEIVGVERTVGSFINFSADYHAPGEILFGGRGAVVLGELDGSMTERLDMLHRLFLDFDENAIKTDNIWGYLWGKEAYGAMLFLTALTNESISDALANTAHRPLYIATAREILTLAQKLNINAKGFNGFDPAAFFPGADADTTEKSINDMVAFNRTSAKTHSGIWRDLAVRKRKTEAAMYAPIITEAERVNVPMPVTQGWLQMIHEIEDGKREQSTANLDELMRTIS